MQKAFIAKTHHDFIHRTFFYTEIKEMKVNDTQYIEVSFLLSSEINISLIYFGLNQ
jgi:hypothetical protein